MHSAEAEGLFGPDSVTWRLHADPVLVLGGMRALLLQALHPRAMAGVATHSGFRTDPWGRLRRTAEYVGVTTYGTTAEAERAGARVRGVHRRLTATDPRTGEPFRVDDPELLAWVHACEVDSFLSTIRRAGMQLTDEESDRYVAEQRRSAELVGLSGDEVPADTAALAAYFARIRPELRATRDALDAARFVVVPPMPAWVRIGTAFPGSAAPAGLIGLLARYAPPAPLRTVARPAWAALAGLAFALLPAWARRSYGIPAVPAGEIGTTIALRGLRAALLLIPESAREGPAIKAAKVRLAGPVGAGAVDPH
jgi:uncharacterized protein (DUF2236 family)